MSRFQKSANWNSLTRIVSRIGLDATILWAYSEGAEHQVVYLKVNKKITCQYVFIKSSMYITSSAKKNIFIYAHMLKQI